LICTAFGSGSLPIGLLIRLLPSFHGKSTDDEGVITEEEVKAEIEEIHRAVVERQENKLGRALSTSESKAWMNAILHSSSQFCVMGSYSHTSRSAFREGVLIGAQMAMEARSASEMPEMPLVTTGSRGKELWNVAGLKVRRQVTVIDAFRRHRRDNTFLGDRGSVGSMGSLRD
jgi:hypothetical protein